jgi:hypothetical protein
MLKKNLIIGLSGKRGVGKSTAADFLIDTHNFKRVSFADKLKETARTFFPFTSVDFSPSGKEKKYKNYDWTPREFLIHLGQFARFHDEDYWVKASGLAAATGKIVIDDVRFPNEVEYLKSVGAKIIRINRFEKLNPYGKNLDDPSETSLDGYKGFDYVVEDVQNIKVSDLYKTMTQALKHFEDEE